MSVRRRALISALGVVAVVAAVVGISVVWPGLDARETPAVDTGLWVLQSGEGRRYARVNTAIGELDTVRDVGNPSGLAQGGDGVFLFSESFGKVTRIDETQPVDIDDAALESAESTPTGTVEVRSNGAFAVYRTDTGALWAGRLGDAPAQVEPEGADGDPERAPYASDAVAISADGILYSYSQADAAVIRWDVGGARLLARDELNLELDAEVVPHITGVGERWMLVDAQSATVWREGEAEALAIPASGTIVPAMAADAGDAFYLADDAGLVRVPFDGDGVRREFGFEAQAQGTPARPVWHDGALYAAWLPTTGGGVLWSSELVEPVPLDFAGAELPDQRRPAFVVGTGAIALNETRSGWVWSVPDGALLPSSQQWIDDDGDSSAQESEQVAPLVIDPKPPVAEADDFGVRAGSLTALPVLLNDHDPNTDVLAIDPASVTGLDPAFGTVSVTDNRQRIAIRVADGATGAATFSYRVTDGTSDDGLYSEPTTVTVRAVTGNSAPEWCGVEGCLAEWPQPEVARGGTVSVPVLQGWVDPDGDPLLLLGVDNPSGEGAAVATPSGEVVYQHHDGGDRGDHPVDLVVTVADTRGATSTRTLTVIARAQPALHAQSFTVVDTIGGSLTVDVAPHVTGTAGQVELTAVRVLDDAPATAVVSGGSTAFDFAATEVGTFRVSFTVGEGAGSATGTAQITILPTDAPAQLSAAPVVAFLHPKEDVTVDVLGAVANPTRRVLLLSDVRPTAADGASLSVDVVGQRYLRVSGSTADGAPGPLGTVRYVVSDGTADEGSRVEGEATVYLLPVAPERQPIAVDDSIEVRVGTQVDIPVLRNDVAPAGSAVTLNPEQVRSSDPSALAFAAGDLLRYLAPTTAGVYEVEYGVYASGSPSLADTATVRIHVTDDGANRAPRPETLEGRVLAGQTTSIPFDDFGVDPDGDAVFLDRIVEQPAAGTASLSADGSAIVYTSVLGEAATGQQRIRYRVVDAFGAVGEGTLRVGVLGAEADPSPVTYTDYVQLQVGQGNSVRVEPLANDIDPFEGELTLVDVRPDVAATLDDGSGSPEFARLSEMVSDRDDTSFVVTAGATPGTMGFLYDVRSESGNTARGLVVVKVVREAVPNFPVVADTVLTAENRDQYTRGVDVVTGKVSWTGGDSGDLELALWGEPDDVEASGHRLRGELPERTRIIPFSLTSGRTSGEADGEDRTVTTFGFLRVPGEQSVPLALRTGTRPQEVEESGAIDIDLSEMVAVPRGSTLEVGTADAAGSRPAATCAIVVGTTVRYSAGVGAPWSDACHVAVRLAGTTDWTTLSVPIRVQPLDPQPILLSGAQTVGPGETVRLDLRDLVRWQGRPDDENLAFQVKYTGARFVVAQEGTVLEITGVDSALPGSDDVAAIAITSHGDVPPARLNLRVGAAPSTLARGGSTGLVCSQATSDSCVITVVGAAGELNPLPRTPLEVVDVRAVGSCAGIAFQVASAETVRASWSADAPGATCAASFSLRDAQGRITSGSRDGTILLDLQGYPRAPASVSQATYGDGHLTLRIDPGEARQAYPTLGGFVVRSGGAVVASCTVDGVCPVISAPNGEERTYEAVAVNAVGESRAAVRTSGWAYDVPAPPSGIVAAPVDTGGAGGVVSLAISGIDDIKTGYIEVSSPVGETVRVPIARGQTELTIPAFRVGANTFTPVTVTPLTRYALPPGLLGSTSGSAVTVRTRGIGAPTALALTLTSTANGDGTSTVRATAAAGPGGDDAATRFGIVRSGTTCTTRDGGATATFRVPDGVEYAYEVCAEAWYQGRMFGQSTASASVRAAQSAAAPVGYTYRVDAVPDIGVGEALWRIRDLPQSAEPLPRNNVAVFEGGPPSSVFDADPGILVRYRHLEWGTLSEPAVVQPAAGSAPHQVWARWAVASCVGGADLAPSASSSGDRAQITFTPDLLVYYDADGAVVAHTPGTWTVPVGAVRVAGIRVAVDWSGQGWGLDAATAEFGAACEPNLPPPPLEQENE